VASKKRGIRLISVDFPLPVEPIKATVSSTVSYHVRFTITDALGSTTTYIATVDSLKIVLEFESSGGRMWARCPTTFTSTLAVDGAATFNNLITSGGNSHLKAAFLAAFNQRIDDRDAIFAAYDEVLAALTDTTALDAEASALAGECEIVAELTRKAVQENARAAMDQDEYNARRDALLARYAAATARQAEIEAERSQRRMKRANITHFLQILKKQENLVTEFEEELWYITVDKVLVYPDKRLSFIFRDGAVVDVSPEK